MRHRTPDLDCGHYRTMANNLLSVTGRRARIIWLLIAEKNIGARPTHRTLQPQNTER